MAGRFGTIGRKVGASVEILYSDDGLTWTFSAGGGGGGSFGRSIAYSPDLHRWAAGSDSGYIWTSDDNTATWTSRTNGFGSESVAAIAWSSELALFVAVGGGGILETSPDGITWTSRTSGFSTSGINDVAWSSTLALFVTVGESGKIGTSSDGTSWSVTQPLTGNPSLRAIECINGSGNELVTFGKSSGFKAYTTDDASSWTTNNFGSGLDTFYDFTGCAYSPDLDTIVTTAELYVYYSTDGGATWSDSLGGSDLGRFTDVAWSPELGLFVIVKNTTGFYTSTDGTSFTNSGQSNPSTNGFFAIAAGGVPLLNHTVGMIRMT